MRDAADYMKVVETCVGLWGIGQGATYAGFSVSCANEKQANFAAHYRSCFETPFIEGDITHLGTVAKMHEYSKDAGIMAFGFSSQHFSEIGDRKQEVDHSASTLPFGLLAAFLLQKDITVLEGMPDEASSPFVQKCLDYHVHAVKADRSETIMELNDLWPAKRRRWWTIITKGEFGRVTVPPLPALPLTPTIHGVLADFMTLLPTEFDQLVLTDRERKGFATYGKGIAAQLVNPHEPLATSLHSWGSEFEPCACQCRVACSDETLLQIGLQGALVRVPNESPDHDLRHVSPREMALLNAVPKTSGWEDSQRLLMAGIGQVSSPLQSAWVFAAIRNHLHVIKYGDVQLCQP